MITDEMSWQAISLRPAIVPTFRLHNMLRLVILVTLTGVLVAPNLRAQDSVRARVLAVDDQRFAAMVRADTAVLRSILAADLAYTHTTGEKQDRTAFLHSVGSGELQYKRIAPTERTVRFVGSDAAVVTGRSNMEVQSQGQVRAFAIRYVAVYERRPDGWQMVAWQSTRIPD
jgi:ketosteroid isomerase-like protein